MTKESARERRLKDQFIPFWYYYLLERDKNKAQGEEIKCLKKVIKELEGER